MLFRKGHIGEIRLPVQSQKEICTIIIQDTVIVVSPTPCQSDITGLYKVGFLCQNPQGPIDLVELEVRWFARSIWENWNVLTLEDG